MSEWISVKDRLPKYGHNVLFCTDEKIVSEGVHGAYGWLGFRWDCMYPDNRVTHWMPLPEPPEVEE